MLETRMKLWKQWIIRKLVQGEFRHYNDNPRSIFAPLYVITSKSLIYIAEEARNEEQENIVKVLEKYGHTLESSKCNRQNNEENCLACRSVALVRGHRK